MLTPFVRISMLFAGFLAAALGAFEAAADFSGAGTNAFWCGRSAAWST
jgi:hypothetical protein